MPQETNLNVSPYFDDFNPEDNYYKVLFKPGYPIQARELTTLQSILQNQTEQFGKHIFKEGSVVIPGYVRVDNPLYCVEIESDFIGTPVSLYFDQLIGKKLRGESSGVSAEVVYILSNQQSDRGNYTLYVKYIESGGANFENRTFSNAETLLLESSLTYGELGFTVEAGQGICKAITSNATSAGSSAIVTDGIYFIRGIFARVSEQRILLDQYGTSPSYKIGFDVIERIVTADQDNQLYDNAKGFSNYAAPGADRFQIELELTKKNINDVEPDNFVEILRVVDGELKFTKDKSQYSLIRDELARRTAAESGDYYVKPFTVSVRECLNDRVLNDGIYFDDQLTLSGNIPSENLMVYEIGPGKAYVSGYDVETISSSLLDVEKPRTTNTVRNQSIEYNAGLSVVVNNAYGSATLGLGTTAYVSLIDSRIGSTAHVCVGSTIGVARVYDFVPESDYIDDTSRLNLRLFDIQTYTTIGLTTTISSLTIPAFIKGTKSNASGYLVENVSNSRILKLMDLDGTFLENESISINGLPENRLINYVKDYDLEDVKSIYSKVGVSTFNADIVLDTSSPIATPGTEFSITKGSGISTITAGLDIKFLNIIKTGDIISYASTNFSENKIYHKVESISASGSSFTVSGLTSVNGINIGTLPTTDITVNNIVKVTGKINDNDSSLLTPLNKENISSVTLENSELLQRRLFTKSLSNNFVELQITEPDLFFASFDEDRFVITYGDGSIEPMRLDKYTLDSTGKVLTFSGLSKSSGNAEIITTVRNLKANSKIKKLNKVSTLFVDKSKFVSSGIGSTTLGDGLTYNKVYGTRVQDEEICLNVPDVIRVLAVCESSGINAPSFPKIQLTSFSGTTNNNEDYIIGEQIKGTTSNSVAIIVNKIEINKLEYVYLNSFQFLEGETIVGKDSNVSSTIVTKIIGDKDITKNYELDDGQRDTIYDYARIIRKSNAESPKRKIKILFQNYTVDTSDTGEFFTASTYSSNEFKNNIPIFDNRRLTDYIDIRPRVSPYVLTENSRSPFEFSSRNLSGQGQYSQYVLVPNENIIVSYSYYLPRVDKVYLTSDGVFKVANGIPNESPVPPSIPNNVLDVATISLLPYLYNVKNVSVNISQHKRYRMSDIALLEDRIQRVEEYTTLSLLEKSVSELSIKDAQTGLDRFKSGFFVDNFSNHDYHDLSNSSFRTAIDTTNSTLRPKHYTTSLELELGSEAIPGFTNTTQTNIDSSYVTDLGSIGIRKTGDLITLNYGEDVFEEQLLASRTESVTPFLIRYWEGSVQLRPSYDTWVEVSNTTTSSTTIQSNSTDATISGTTPSVQTGVPSFDWISNARNIFSSSNNRIGGGFLYSGLVIGSRYNWERNPVPAGRIISPRFNLKGRIDLISRDVVDDQVSSGIINGNTIRLEYRPPLFIRRLRASEVEFIRKILPPDIANNFINEINSQFASGRSRRRRIISIDFTPSSTNPPTTGGPIPGPLTPPTPIGDPTTDGGSDGTPDNFSLRSRNIEFDAKTLKPRTRFYPFFQGVDVSRYITPKLLEVTMVSGVFRVGETVISDPNFTTSKISFRICKPNHKEGPFDGSPVVSGEFSQYTLNPYTQQPFADTYSASSTVLNVDTRSLQLPSEVEFFGVIAPGMRLIGRTSGAVATVNQNIRLISDNTGRLIGSLFIPSPNTPGNPRWSLRENTFTLIDRQRLTQENTEEAIANIIDSESSASTQFSYEITIRRPTPPSPPQPPTPLPPLPPTLPPTLPPITPPITNVCPGVGVYLDLNEFPSTQTVTVVLSVVANESSIFHEIVIPEVGTIRENDRPQTYELRGGRSYGPITAPRGRTFVGNETPSDVRRNAGSRPITQLVVEERRDDWNDMVIETNRGFFRRCPTPVPLSTPTGQRRKPFRPRPFWPRKDPLAQSFVVQDPTGVFLTSVDVFFETKDEVLPIIMQIRPMIAGVPSEVILPYGEVVITPDKVNLSVDGSIATKFTFPSPVYLSSTQRRSAEVNDTSPDQSSEYAFVLLSNSPNYRVFISQMGERDILTGNRISEQPILGSLFKSQNGSTWSPSQLEDLKYRINVANFISEGLVRFYNTKLSGNNKVTIAPANSFVPLSKKIVVGLGSTGYNSDVVPGVTLIQGSASGKLVGIAGSVRVGAGVTVEKVGFGYTNGVFTDVSLVTETGYGQGAKATVSVASSEINSVTITNGGIGYQRGDSLLIPNIGRNVGYGGRVTVVSIASSNTFVIDNVQGSFAISGINTINYINSVGITTITGNGVTISSITEDQFNDGLHMKVYHPNHGMHSTENYVKIENVRPIFTEVNARTTESITDSSLTISVDSITGFDTFEGQPVSGTNPGYIIIGNEVMKYTTPPTSNSITVTERGVDGTIKQPYTISSSGTGYLVYKYEFNGVSLRRINKIHNFAEVDVNKHPIDLDNYYIKVDMDGVDFDNGSIGKNRTNDLYFRETIQTGESGSRLSNNIQYEILTPNIDYFVPNGSQLSGRIRTITGTSIGGNEKSFVDAGFQDISLDNSIYFKTPRIICSNINESKFIDETPGNRSFTMELSLSSDNPRVSPFIDLTPSPSIVLTSNLINNPIGLQTASSYALDDKVRSLNNDPHAAIYVSKPVNLTIPANSIKVLLSANKDINNDIRVLYQLFRNDSSESSQNFELFPGYSNYQVDGQGIKRVIDPSMNDGSADSYNLESSDGFFKDYVYTVDDLPSFTGFAIKIVMASENQASPPLVSNLRVIATAKPTI
jgi:flagellar basal body rod protein FlgC